MSLKKHISLLTISTLLSQSLTNNAFSRVIPLSEYSNGTPVNIEDLNKKVPDGTYVETFKVYRDDLELSWKPYFAKNSETQKEGFYKVTHIYKKNHYSNGTSDSVFVLLLDYPTARAQILNAIEFSQKLLSLENNDLITIQLSKTFKDNSIVDQKISIVSDKEMKKYSFNKDLKGSSDVVIENIKDKNGKILKVMTFKNLPIDLIN